MRNACVEDLCQSGVGDCVRTSEHVWYDAYVWCVCVCPWNVSERGGERRDFSFPRVCRKASAVSMTSFSLSKTLETELPIREEREKIGQWRINDVGIRG